MDPFALQKAFFKQVQRTVATLKTQAPGAKMVGEFAVKMAHGELKKKMNRSEQKSSENEQQGDQPA